MHCFAHNTVPAVGICKSCGKGICSQCATDSEHGLACSAICMKRLELMGALITHNAKSVAHNAKVMTMANKQVRSMAIFGVVMGVLFLGFSYISYIVGNVFAV